MSVDRHGAEHGPWRRSSAPAAGTMHLEAHADGPKLAQAYFNILLFGVRRMVTYPNSGEIAVSGQQGDLESAVAPQSWEEADGQYSRDSHQGVGSSDSKGSVLRASGHGGAISQSGQTSDDTRNGRQTTVVTASGGISGRVSGSETKESYLEQAPQDVTGSPNGRSSPETRAAVDDERSMLEQFGVNADTGKPMPDGVSSDSQDKSVWDGERTVRAKVVAGLSPLPPPLWDLDQVRRAGQIPSALVDELDKLLRGTNGFKSASKMNGASMLDEAEENAAEATEGRGEEHPSWGGREWRDELREQDSKNAAAEQEVHGQASANDVGSTPSGSSASSRAAGPEKQIPTAKEATDDVVRRIHCIGDSMARRMAGVLSPRTARNCAPMCLSWVRSCITSMYVDMLERGGQSQMGSTQDDESDGRSTVEKGNGSEHESQAKPSRSMVLPQKSRSARKLLGRSFNSVNRGPSGSQSRGIP